MIDVLMEYAEKQDEKQLKQKHIPKNFPKGYNVRNHECLKDAYTQLINLEIISKEVNFIDFESTFLGSEPINKIIWLKGPALLYYFIKITSKPYLTARKTSIPCTFDEVMAKSLIGQTLPGEIERIEVDEYEFLIPGTKKKLKLSHSYQYSAEPVTIAEVVG